MKIKNASVFLRQDDNRAFLDYDGNWQEKEYPMTFKQARFLAERCGGDVVGYKSGGLVYWYCQEQGLLQTA